MISIITPTYNREDLVQRTIQSIIAQTFTDWELIVVDDGSTDNTEQKIQYLLKDERIKYVKKTNTGQADSLNTGVSYASGEFITFLDSDDEAYDNWLEVVFSHIKKDTGVVCIGAVRKALDGTITNDDLAPYNFYGELIPIKFTCGSFFIKREVFHAVGGYDISLKSNIQTDLGYRIITHLKKNNLEVVGVNVHLVQINIHDGPRIRTSWDKTRIGGIQFYKKHKDYFKNYDPKGLSFICSSIAFSSYKSEYKKEALNFLVKAIRYNPYRMKNYLKLIKYACT